MPAVGAFACEGSILLLPQFLKELGVWGSPLAVSGDQVLLDEILEIFLGTALLKSQKFLAMLNVDAVEDKHYLTYLDTAFASGGRVNLMGPARFGINITYVLHVTSGSWNSFRERYRSLVLRRKEELWK
jgi:hypothetical protein